MTVEERDKVFRENAIDCGIKLREMFDLVEKLKEIINRYDLNDISRDDVGNTVSGFEYEMIMAIQEFESRGKK
jgi:hypothetical protein